jgi:hypothetical protein
MNYPKPAILSTVAPSSPKYIAVPEYKTQSIERKSSKGIIFDDFDSFGDDVMEGSGSGMSQGLKTALVVGVAAIAIYFLYKQMKKRR